MQEWEAAVAAEQVKAVTVKKAMPVGGTVSEVSTSGTLRSAGKKVTFGGGSGSGGGGGGGAADGGFKTTQEDTEEDGGFKGDGGGGGHGGGPMKGANNCDDDGTCNEDDIERRERRLDREEWEREREEWDERVEREEEIEREIERELEERERLEECEVCYLDGEIFIGEVDREKYILGDRREVTIDSAAEESVCPKEWEESSGTAGVEEGEKLKLINASGGRINHFGSRRVNFEAEDTEGEGGMMGLVFQVSDVRKPLAAVWRIAEKGNLVCFGPEEGDNYIMNKKSGKKVLLKKRGGSYIMRVQVIREKSTFQRQV